MKPLLLILLFTGSIALAQTRIVGPGTIERKGKNSRVFRPNRSATARQGAARPTTQLQREVDTLIMNLGSRNEPIRERTRTRLKTLGAKAVPRLIAHIEANDLNMKLLGLSSLLYSWSDQAQPVVEQAYLFDQDTVAKVAFAVMQKRVATGKMSQVKLDGLRAKKK